MTISNVLQNKGRQYKGIQLVNEKGGVTEMYSIYNDTLVGKRVIVKDSSRLGSVVQDGSLKVNPFVAVRVDTEINLIKVLKLDEVILIGGVQNNGN